MKPAFVVVVLVTARALRFRRVRCLLPATPALRLTGAVDRILSEQRRLKEEEKSAEALLVEYQQKASEALARLTRVRKQKESLMERGVEMVTRGLSNLEELEHVEREEAAASSAPSLGPADPLLLE